MKQLLLLQLLLAAGLALVAPAQTATDKPAPGPRQVWDFATELEFTREQREAFDQLRRDYEKARVELRATSNDKTPPDIQRAAQLAFNDQLRLTNRRIAELLSESQKQKWAQTRLAARGLSSMTEAPPSAESSATSGEDSAEGVQSGSFTRKPPRPALTEGELQRLTAELRTSYAKPPGQWPAPEIDEAVKPHFVELGLLPPVPYPTNNPYSFAKAELGKKLFFDPRLSGSGQISCASCHDPDLAFADGRTVAFGNERKELKRNAPTILNSGLGKSYFWDGRAATLEQQTTDVVHNADEMHSNAELIQQRLSRIPGYTNEFASVFGSPQISMTRVAQAIATFERTITSRGNAFDSFLRGDTNALSDPAIRGLHLFRTSARCINCHHGPNFTDERFHDEGLSYYGRKLQDLGRYEITKEPKDVGAFKTPTLRNISRTAPYMHNGLFDLDGVLNMYNAGMATLQPRPHQKNDPLFPVKSPHLQGLGLNHHDLTDLKAFLESLTETRVRIRPPEMHAEAPGEMSSDTAQNKN